MRRTTHIHEIQMYLLYSMLKDINHNNTFGSGGRANIYFYILVISTICIIALNVLSIII